MPRFRIQSNLHLDGFQMLDACLENVTSFEGLSDRNTGRIVFLNGSSSNKSNLHPAVFYDNEFKGLAYLDDIEKITNGEGSLGTRVKALEDMLNVDSAETVVSTWEEIQAFLDNVKEGTDLMTMLDGKLDKTGGTISNNQWANQLILNHSTAGEPAGLRFHSNNEMMGVIYVNYQHRLLFHNGTTPNLEVLHSGNVGDYAALKDGSNATGRWKNGAEWLETNHATPTTSLNELVSASNAHKMLYYMGWAPSDAPEIEDWANALLHINRHNSGGASQLLFNSKGKIFYRATHPSTVEDSDWKTIAFTDSTVEAANRLANKVSLWGNEFDGTKSIMSRILMSNNTALEFYNADKSKAVNAVVFNSSNLMGFGYGAMVNKYPVRYYGGTIEFVTNNTTAMTITDDGNVLVGRATNAFGARISTLGRVHIEGDASSVSSIGDIPANGLTIGYDTLHVMAQWVHGGNGSGNIQAMRVDSDKKVYALNLNPLGGEVTVEDGGLIVAGFVSIGTINRANLYFNRDSANYIWANKAGGYFSIGVKDVGDTSGANASLKIASTSVTPGERNNAVSLGTSSYRWSNVYSVGGNFSGRVLIGGAADDEETALQVNNTISIGESKTNFGLKLDRSTIYSWLPENYAYGHNAHFGLKIGDTLLGVFGHHREGNGDYYAFIGISHTSPWFTINSTESFFNVATTFYGGALIPTGQKLTIGDATIEYDSEAKAIKVDGNLFTTGTNASGGKADAQQGGTGGNAEVYRHDLGRGEQVYEIQNVKGDVNVNVQVYEWNGNGNSWDMILTDVSVTADIITVTFGRPTSVDHMVTVV